VPSAVCSGIVTVIGVLVLTLLLVIGLVRGGPADEQY
jgi:hypothetical protein